MILTRTEDNEIIKSVLCHPEIYNRIQEDGAPNKEDFEPPANAMYITDSHNIAVMVYHWASNITLECHIHVLPEHRKDASKFCQLALEWAWDNTEATKIVAQIPDLYPDVLKFAIKNGFVIEGYNSESYMKDGNIYSQFYLGIKRP